MEPETKTTNSTNDNVRDAEPLVSEDELIIPGESTEETESTVTNPNFLAIIIGVLIVALVIIFGGLYLWGGMLSEEMTTPTPVTARPTAEENNEPESTTAEAQVETATALSTSDSLSAIQADLENTDLNGLTSELGAIEAEFENAATVQ